MPPSRRDKFTSVRSPSKFVGLHSHSGFSTFDGLDYPQDHIDYVVKNGMDAWSLTDHGHMNGFCHAYLHSQKIIKAGVNFKFIPGCEMYLHPNLDEWRRDFAASQSSKKPKPREDVVTPIVAITDENDDHVAVVTETEGLTVENEEESKSGKFYDPIVRRHHLVVLPRTSVGLQRLFHLVSQGYADGFYRFPRIDYRQLKEAAKGGHLLVTSACTGGNLSYEVFQYLQQLKFDELKAELYDTPGLRDKILRGISNAYDQMVDAVGPDAAFLELQFNKLPAQHLVNRALLDFAKENNLTDKLVVTCDSHYSSPSHWREREIYKKLGWLNSRQIDPSQLPASQDELKCELYPKNASQVWETYAATTEGYDFYDDEIVRDAIERTHDIAHNMVGDIKPDTSMKLPSYVIPEGKTAQQALVDLCKKGLMERGLADKAEYIERLKYELGVIREKKFSQYFLTMKKIIDVAWRNQIVGPGRGSGAGSLVNYVLGITNVDPIKYNLLFERFLDPMRTEYPDIDTDFADRDGLIDELRAEFGDDNVIPISNYNTFKLKSLIKDVSRFYGLEFQDVNRALATLDDDVKSGRKHDDSEATFDISLDEALKYSKSTREFLEQHPEIQLPLQVLYKQNKALGRHAGGVIVSENIKERMPLIKAKGELQTPWVEGMTAKQLEPMGWVKFDLLGCETLRIIDMTIRLILVKAGNPNPTFEDVRAWFKERMDPEKLDLNDQEVYRNVYHEGRFAGIFQCSQKGAQKLFINAKPESIIDIATLTSIYRPGPLSANVDKTYIKAKKNPEVIDYGHPLIKQVLESTYNHIVFQEQAMALCNVVAGIPKEELNKVRKMMKPGGSSGENVEKAKALKMRFIDGAVANGVEKRTADELYEKILYFSGYGFNASHAVSYAVVSYYCAWFLTHYEAEWLCAYLDAMSNNPDKLTKALNEVKALGYKISRVDINNSGTSWSCLPGKIMVPSFSSCKGLGNAAITEIMENRPYRNVQEFLWNEDGSWKHSKLNKKGIEVLLQIRAFDSMEWKELFSSYKQFHNIVIENWHELRKSTKKDPFKGLKTMKELILQSNDDSEWTAAEIAKNTMTLLGTLNVAAMIPEEISEKFEQKGIGSIDDYKDENLYWFVAMDVSRKRTKTNKPYIILNAMGNTGQKKKVFVWGTPEDFTLEEYSIVAAQVKNGDFGFSTNWNRLIKLN